MGGVSEGRWDEFRGQEGKVLGKCKIVNRSIAIGKKKGGKLQHFKYTSRPHHEIENGCVISTSYDDLWLHFNQVAKKLVVVR